MIPDAKWDARVEADDQASPQGSESLGTNRPDSPAVLEVDLGFGEPESPRQEARSERVDFDCEPEPLTQEVSLGIDFSDPGPPPRRTMMVLGPNLEYLGEIDEPPVVIDPKAKPPVRLRQSMVLMERPFFALNKSRRTAIDYRSRDGSIRIWVEPGPRGMATTYDADLLIFLVGKISFEQFRDADAVLLRPVELFEALGSKKGGDQYRLLEESLFRLSTTRVTTNAGPDGKPGIERQFCWLDEAKRVAEGWLITPCAWLRAGAQSNYLLAINPDFFALGGIERCLYLTARKHTGSGFGSIFGIKVDTLFLKSGSAGQKARFKHEVRLIVARDSLPDYTLRWVEHGRMESLRIEMMWDGLSATERTRRKAGV